MDKKNAYFYINLNIPKEFSNSEYLSTQLSNSVDLILYSMGVSNDNKHLHIFKKINGTRIIYIFKSITRKRNGQLDKFCHRYLPQDKDIDFQSKGIKSAEIPAILHKIEMTGEFIMDPSKSLITDNDFADIKIFKNKANWHQWQKKVYEMIYNKKELRQPDHREIVSIIDFKGNSGKSSFFKFMYVNDRENIGRLSYGSASQLRSAAINIGKKRIYIIDLTRTKSKNDTEEDLLSVIEDIKSGFVLSPMYGKSGELLMNPPHIIISSNYLLNQGMLSKDRWSVYEITEQSKLGSRNTLLKKKNSKN